MAAAITAAVTALLTLLLGRGAADCPSTTWIEFRSNCYVFLQGTVDIKNIEDVREQCTGHGADIISIQTKEENTFVLKSFETHWQGPDYVLLGMFYDTDDKSFKWYDQSNMTFSNWTDEEAGEELIDTCAFLHTKSGIWKKGSCEVSSLEGSLCKAAVSYKKRYLPEKHVSVTFLVITGTIILAVAGATVWFLHKRNLFSNLPSSGSTALPQTPYSDDCVLVEAEENEYFV
ncbi:CD302 antigen [Tachyglossus aculeatus]|uniref:CD302 antigen n=1 Tax=Tachyglossus aculeatus TaxID=9261 RepID=UPI0018F336C2|nr:CD302 antigen [Tachyglossus aculeatus]